MFDELSAWDTLAIGDGSQSGGLSPYIPPSGEDIIDSSIVNSSGFSVGTGDLLKAGSSILGAAGNLMSGSETQAAYEYNAQLALEQGQFAIQDLDIAEEDTLSTQRAMYAKSGVTMSGSPLDTATNTAYGYEMDKQIANYNAQSKANMDIYQGKVAKSQGQIKAGESLLSGASSLITALL